MEQHDKFFVCFVAVALLLHSVAAFDTCSYTNAQGETWDLSSLAYNPTEESPAGYSITSSINTYYVNFCAAVSNVNASSCNSASQTGACQEVSGSFFHPLGEVQDSSFVDYVC